MSEEILINVTPQETRVAVMQLGVVQDLHIERGSNRGIVSNVYLGRVKRVLPGMQSAFIDIGLERSAFLHVADIWENSNNGDVAKPIEKVLYESQTLLVQVIKEPLGTKGARLSTQLSIAGRLLVYLPQEKHIGVSQRIESEEQRDALRARLQAVLWSVELWRGSIGQLPPPLVGAQLDRDHGPVGEVSISLQQPPVSGVEVALDHRHGSFTVVAGDGLD